MKTLLKTISLLAFGAVYLGVARDIQPRAPMDEPTLVVLVYDYTERSHDFMQEMETVSGAILARVGIRTAWVHCLDRSVGPVCGGDMGTKTVIIRIVARHQGPLNKLGDPLGSATVESGFATMYLSEIRSNADRYGMRPASLMAYATAHEIGHLLLGKKHAVSGIMRAVWDKNEYRKMAQCWFGFTVDEREALRQWVHVHEEPVARVK